MAARAELQHHHEQSPTTDTTRFQYQLHTVGNAPTALFSTNVIPLENHSRTNHHDHDQTHEHAHGTGCGCGEEGHRHEAVAASEALHKWLPRFETGIQTAFVLVVKPELFTPQEKIQKENTLKTLGITSTDQSKKTAAEIAINKAYDALIKNALGGIKNAPKEVIAATAAKLVLVSFDENHQKTLQTKLDAIPKDTQHIHMHVDEETGIYDFHIETDGKDEHHSFTRAEIIRLIALHMAEDVKAEQHEGKENQVLHLLAHALEEAGETLANRKSFENPDQHEDGIHGKILIDADGLLKEENCANHEQQVDQKLQQLQQEVQQSFQQALQESFPNQQPLQDPLIPMETDFIGVPTTFTEHTNSLLDPSPPITVSERPTLIPKPQPSSAPLSERGSQPSFQGVSSDTPSSPSHSDYGEETTETRTRQQLPLSFTTLSTLSSITHIAPILERSPSYLSSSLDDISVTPLQQQFSEIVELPQIEEIDMPYNTSHINTVDTVATPIPLRRIETTPGAFVPVQETTQISLPIRFISSDRIIHFPPVSTNIVAPNEFVRINTIQYLPVVAMSNEDTSIDSTPDASDELGNITHVTAITHDIPDIAEPEFATEEYEEIPNMTTSDISHTLPSAEKEKPFITQETEHLEQSEQAEASDVSSTLSPVDVSQIILRRRPTPDVPTSPRIFNTDDYTEAPIAKPQQIPDVVITDAVIQAFAQRDEQQVIVASELTEDQEEAKLTIAHGSSEDEQQVQQDQQEVAGSSEEPVVTVTETVVQTSKGPAIVQEIQTTAPQRTQTITIPKTNETQSAPASLERITTTERGTQEIRSQTTPPTQQTPAPIATRKSSPVGASVIPLRATNTMATQLAQGYLPDNPLGIQYAFKDAWLAAA